jgi:hypothetical protein
MGATVRQALTPAPRNTGRVYNARAAAISSDRTATTWNAGGRSIRSASLPRLLATVPAMQPHTAAICVTGRRRSWKLLRQARSSITPRCRDRRCRRKSTLMSPKLHACATGASRARNSYGWAPQVNGRLSSQRPGMRQNRAPKAPALRMYRLSRLYVWRNPDTTSELAASPGSPHGVGRGVPGEKKLKCNSRERDQIGDHDKYKSDSKDGGTGF